MKVWITKSNGILGEYRDCILDHAHDGDERCDMQPIKKPLTNKEDIMWWWHDRVFLEDGLTFEEFLIALRGIEGIESLSSLVTTDLASVFKQMDEPAPVTKIVYGDDIWRLEVYWSASINDDGQHWCRPEFHGWGTWKNTYSENAEVLEGGWGIEYSHIASLMHLPLILANKYDIMPRFNRLKDKPVLEAYRDFTLGEFLYAIFFELEVHSHLEEDIDVSN